MARRRSSGKKEKCKEHDLLVNQRAHKRKRTHARASVWHINHTKEFYKMQLDSPAEPKPKVVAVVAIAVAVAVVTTLSCGLKIAFASRGKRLTTYGSGLRRLRIRVVHQRQHLTLPATPQWNLSNCDSTRMVHKKFQRLRTGGISGTSQYVTPTNISLGYTVLSGTPFLEMYFLSFLIENVSYHTFIINSRFVCVFLLKTKF